MNDHEYRSEVVAELLAGRREGLIGGGFMQLVTLRLHDAPAIADAITGEPSTRPGAFTDLRPGEARRLADQLLERARDAEALRRESDR